MRRENIQRFSLRKLSVGLLSVTVGSVFLSFSDQEVAATELDQEEAAIRYHYVTEDELTPQEKEQIIQALPSLHAEQVSDYYLVYRPESVQEGSQNLPQTGTALLNPALALGSVALFIVGLKFTKKKTAKVTVALFLTGAGGFVLSSDALALSNVVLAQYNQIVNVGADGRLPAPMDIPDYRYIGYLKMDKAGGLLLPEGSESTDRLGLLQGLPNPSQEESSLLYPVPPVVAPQVPEETPAPGEVVPEPPVVIPEPPVVTPEPPVVTPDPPVVTPEPSEVVPEPPVVTPEPPVVTPEPGEVVPEPPVVTPEPPVVTPDPPVVTPDPGEVVPEPPVVTPEPPVVIPEPPVVTPEPPVVTPEPGEVVPEPPVVTPDPPVVTPEPPVVTPDPPVVIPEPPVVTPDPPVVTPDPGEVVPEPPVVTPEPPVVTPEPPVVTPEPGEVVPEPPVVTPEPEKDVLEVRYEDLLFETVYEADEGLAYGYQKILEEGIRGTKKIVWNVTKQELVSEQVVLPPTKRLVRVGTQPHINREELPFKEIRQEDPSLEKGQERVVTEGRVGLETSTARYSVDAKTGQVTALPVEVETRPAEDRVIAVGTKEIEPPVVTPEPEDVLETRQESIAFETVYESDESLAYGSSQVAQEGVAGTKELVWNVTKDSLVSESVTSPAVSQIVRVGTQPSVTTKELPFKEIRQDDPTLEKGQERVVTEGRVGLETSTTRYSVDAKTGQVTALPVEVETRPAEDRVIAVGTKEDVLETRQESIAFETVYESDESLAYGSSQVAQEGIAGTKELVWNVTKDSLVSESVTSPAVSQIVRVGTQPSVTTKGLPFKEVRQDDPTLEKGQERVVTEGRVGLETSTTRYSVDAKTGQVTALPVEVETRPAEDRVIAVGTKEIELPVVTPEPEDVLETRQESIAFETVYESDESLAYGSSQVAQEGVAGTKELVWNVTKDSLVSESVTSPAVSRIVRVGTQPSVTTKELPFKEVRQDDPNLEKGQERVVTEGRAGLETSTTRYSVDASTGQVTALP
ncbi:MULTISPECIES: G5 domain-containing protein, partial [unclassified Streptococcus]|uniref:G5 domain-containing protein n=1 Tax=unclassified Streptococcus TaxID=2608887 RepID=UPI001072E670